MSYLLVSRRFSSHALDVLYRDNTFFHHATDASSNILSFVSEENRKRIRSLTIFLTPGMDDEFLSKQRHHLEREAWWPETLQQLNSILVHIEVFRIPRGSNLPKVYDYQLLSAEWLDRAFTIIARNIPGNTPMQTVPGWLRLDKQVKETIV